MFKFFGDRLKVKCSECGADVEVPGSILHDAEKWQKLLKYQKENKAENRKKNSKYCQTKKKEAN
jgi:hypothetical protein